MKTSDFDYDLPPKFIAQNPIEPRDSSRLLVLHRDTGKVEHAIFHQLSRFLKAGDLLVINQTRVIPARMFARKSTGGRVEILLLRRRGNTIWEVLVGGKGVGIGIRLSIEGGPEGDVVDDMGGSRRRICFAEPIEPFFPSVGHVPLPPYIHEKLSDPERYQTIYAREPGSAAAPTAGLHFTSRVFDEIKLQGINTATVTLHVGLDTFAPVTEINPQEHQIHSEWCELPQATVDAIQRTHQAGNRVIAVGTTTVRTIENAASESGISSYSGDTQLFIIPGYRFKVVDAIITNFHLPKSTLIMLISAFAGREKILDTYEIAKREGYRFYSFGDAMLIL